jgi:MerR family copper efflux transcriptional regulator
MDTPIACSLPPAAFRERRASIDQMVGDALRSRERIDGGLRATFSAEAEPALRDLIAAEAECCPFLRMDLTRSGDAVVLDVTGPNEAQPLLAEMFA